jgi:uncharacterized repeat protein (TIGR01451 family)
VGDRVWLDTNANGIQDTNETGIENVTVNLLDGNGNPTGQTTTTDSDGYYLFEGLSGLSYRVEFVIPDGFLVSPMNTGSDVGTDSDADPTTGVTGSVELGPGDVDRTLDVGLFQPSSLGDFVWFDADDDGVQDADEAPVVGLAVRLLGADGSEVASTVTDDAGAYLFDALIPGDYIVEFDLLDGHRFSPQAAGADIELDSNTTASGTTSIIELGNGEHRRDVDAGLVEERLDLMLDLALTNDPSSGDVAVYEITVTNTGNTDVPPGTTVVDQLPVGLDYERAFGTGWTFTEADGTVTAIYSDSLAPGESAPPITLRARVTANSGQLVNSATVRAPGGLPEVVTTNNDGNQVLDLGANSIPDLAFTGTESQRTVLMGLLLLVVGLAVRVLRRDRRAPSRP